MLAHRMGAACPHRQILPRHDDDRTRIFSEFEKVTSVSLRSKGRLKGILLYTWQGDFRSGENIPTVLFYVVLLTKSGRLAVAPMGHN
jgi:hypothetical protein